MPASLADRWARVGEAVEAACSRSGRKPETVSVVAVTKTFPVETLLSAYEAGVRIFGENYVQEAGPKMETFSAKGISDVEWHFVGALQSKKARKVLGPFSLIHSLDRWSLAQALERESKKKGVKPVVLVEVNSGEEENKAGLRDESLRLFLEQVSQDTSIEVRGLMTFPPYFEDSDRCRPYFARIRELAAEIQKWGLPRVQMEELSMGISGDFEVAIEEGATLIRLGTAIFGPRNQKRK